MMSEYQKDCPKTIESMFDNIAIQYDRVNSLMSMNMHKRWNAALIKSVSEKVSLKSYLDLCSGTGEIGFGLMKQLQLPCEAFLLDFSENMLSVARRKSDAINLAKGSRIHFLKADAQEIPLPSESIDGVTIAYGIRNVKDPKKCIQEVCRVLRKGGAFSILELTRPKNPLLKSGHRMYMRTLLPVIGKFAASDSQAYRYLCQSVQDFPQPEVLENHLKEAGFEQTRVSPLTLGIATLISGYKRY